MVTPLLQVLGIARGSSKASLTPKNDGRWRRILLVHSVCFNLQETCQNLELKLVTGFQLFG
jgi:hypothetical protein